MISRRRIFTDGPARQIRPIRNVPPNAKVRLRIRWNTCGRAFVKVGDTIAEHIIVLGEGHDDWEILYPPQAINRSWR